MGADTSSVITVQEEVSQPLLDRRKTHDCQAGCRVSLSRMSSEYPKKTPVLESREDRFFRILGVEVGSPDARVLSSLRLVSSCVLASAGFQEMGETGEEGAAREAREEMNAEIDVRGLLAVYCLPHIGQT